MGKAVEILSNLKVRNLGFGLHRDGGGLVLVVEVLPGACGACTRACNSFELRP
jgi:hypothetical protein